MSNNNDELISRGGAAAGVVGMGGLFLILDGLIPFLGSAIVAGLTYKAARKSGT